MEHITASDIMRIREFCGKEVESRGSEICDLAIEGLRLQSINAELVAALEDMLSGWKYIRETHGDLYGVGWDRAEGKARAALSKAKES